MSAPASPAPTQTPPEIHRALNVGITGHRAADLAALQASPIDLSQRVRDILERLAAIVGEHAGELIQMWSLAISQKMKIKAMMGWISPYPTLSEVNKRVAYRQYATAASNTVVRKVIGWLKVFG